MFKPGIISLLVFSFLQFLFLIVSSTCYCQTKIPGNYQSNKRFTNVSLILNSDSTFNYTRSYHMIADIANGQYITKADTIFLYFNPFRNDTIYADGRQSAAQLGQWLGGRPDTLVYKKDKLYTIENERIINKTKREPVKYFSKNKDWRKWYRKKYYLFGPYILKKRNTYYVQKIN